MSRTMPFAITPAQLAILIAIRFVIATAFRLVYPLLPFLAGRLAVDTTAVSAIITVQAASGLLGLGSGVIADRAGSRATMAAGLLCFAAGCAGCMFSTSYWPFLAGYGLIGAGSAVFLPALQRYVSEATPFARRGRALGALELSWALGGIVGVPLLVWLVTATDTWSLAFGLLLSGGLLALGATLTLLPSDERSAGAESVVPFWTVLRQPGVAATISFLALLMGSQELMFIVQSDWQAQRLGLDTAARGWLFSGLGAAELLASLIVTLVADRLGLRRLVLAAATMVLLLHLVLPTTLGSLASYGLTLALLIFGFELTLVAALPVLSELTPATRGTTLALGATAMLGGRSFGSLLGTPLSVAYGPWSVGFMAAGMLALGVALLGSTLPIFSSAAATPEEGTAL